MELPVLIGNSQPGNNCSISANSGLPALSMPLGFTDQGLPVAMELLGGFLEDETLLALAFKYEQTMVPRRAPSVTLEFLGLAEESFDDQQSSKTPSRSDSSQPALRATVTPLRRGSKNGVSDVNEILTVHPKKYEDAKTIAETFREGIPVIINLTQMI